MPANQSSCNWGNWLIRFGSAGGCAISCPTNGGRSIKGASGQALGAVGPRGLIVSWDTVAAGVADNSGRLIGWTQSNATTSLKQANRQTQQITRGERNVHQRAIAQATASTTAPCQDA
jgi:hypothetical protein